MIVPKPSGVGYDIFIRMELLRSLDERANAAPLLETEIVKIGIDICKALELLERERLIHRDIKPANIFLNSAGDYKLGDFGVARTLENAASGVTLKGTLNYMAPEIAKGQPVTNTADIYSLGIVLYRYLNGNRLPLLPPTGQITYDESQRALDRRMAGEFLPPPAYASLPGLRESVLRACEYEPGRRFRSAGEMRHALESVLAGTPDWSVINPGPRVGGAPPPQPGWTTGGGSRLGGTGGGPVPPPKKNNTPLIIGISVGAVVVVALAIVIGIMLSRGSSRGGSGDALDSTAPPSAPVSSPIISDGKYSHEELNRMFANVESDWLGGTFQEAAAGYGLDIFSDPGSRRKMIYIDQNPGYILAYSYDKPFFVFMTYNGAVTDRLYYDTDGETLLRWVDESGTIHDNDTENYNWYSLENQGLVAARNYDFEPDDVEPTDLNYVRREWGNMSGQLASFMLKQWGDAVRLCDQNPGSSIYSSTGERLYSSGDVMKSRFVAIKIDNITWTDAADAALRAGGYLAVPNNQQEWQAIIAACNDADVTRVWIGGYNQIEFQMVDTGLPSNTDAYVRTDWVDGTSSSSLPWWYDGEPSCYDPGTACYEQYVLMWDVKNTGSWTLNDVPDDPWAYNPKGYAGLFGYVIEYN